MSLVALDSKQQVELLTGLREIGLDLSIQQLDQLKALVYLLLEWGQQLNLTGHRNPTDIQRKLILESVALGAALPTYTSLVDLGSGAGFPGLPLAICCPERRFTLVESREKRVYFQRFVVRELQLSNVQSLRGRAEVLSPDPADLVIAMAMAKPEQVLEWMPDWVLPGGSLILPLGARRPRLTPPNGFQFENLVDYNIPFSKSKRALWIARKLG